MADQNTKRIIIKAAYNYFQSGQWDKALEEYLKIVSIDPMDFLVHNMIAEIYLRKNDTALAVQEFLKAANLLHATKNIDKALLSFQHVLKIDPNNAVASKKIEDILQERLGEIDALAARQEFDEAVSLCEELLDRFQQSEALQAKIMDLRELKSAAEAAVASKEAFPSEAQAPELAATTHNPPTLGNKELIQNLYGMAETYEQRHAWEQAFEAYMTILRLNPSEQRVQEKIRELYHKKAEEAAQHAEESRRASLPAMPAQSPASATIEDDKRLSPTVSEEEPYTLAEDSGTSALPPLNDWPPHDTLPIPKMPPSSSTSAKDLETLRKQAEARLKEAALNPQSAEKKKEMLFGAGKKNENLEVVPQLIKQVRSHIQANELTRAMRVCRDIIGLDPENRQVKDLLLEIYSKKNL